MSDHFETELKYGLPNQASWERLQKLCRGTFVTRHQQENHFFANNGPALPYRFRLRQEDAAFILGVKTAGQTNGLLSTRREEECLVSVDEAAELLQNETAPALLLLKKRPDLGATPFGKLLLADARQLTFHYVGSFKNTRLVYSYEPKNSQPPHKLMLEFDCCTFPNGKTDYELEIEVPPENAEKIDKEFRQLMTISSINFQQVTSKAARFFAALK